MTKYFFNSCEYIELEARRLAGIATEYSMEGVGTSQLIVRHVPRLQVIDAISVYGYPNFVTNRTEESDISIKHGLSKIIPALASKGVVSAFFRLGFGEGEPIDFINLDRGIACVERVGSSIYVSLQKTREEIFSGYRSNLRYDLRKSSEVRVERSFDSELFIEIYYENMDRIGAGGEYYFESEYINNLLNINSSELYIGWVKNKPVSAVIIIKHGDNVFYHLGSTTNYGLPYSPIKNMLSYLILENSGGNFKRFVLGGGVGGNMDKLLQFKRGFSKESADVYVAKVIPNSERYEKLCGGLPDNVFSGFFPKYRSG